VAMKHKKADILPIMHSFYALYTKNISKTKLCLCQSTTSLIHTSKKVKLHAFLTMTLDGSG